MALLPKQIPLKATRIDSSILPENFSIPYRLYVQKQSKEIENIADVTQAIAGDYVSKRETSLQSLSSPIDIKTAFSIDGTKVIGPRVTGWIAGSGPQLTGEFNASQTYAAGAAYSQAEINAIITGLVQARQRVMALEAAMRSHGLIN
ncbi:hypothetical protein [Atlantibacter sp.]|uniref:hypothetical protein n=1 Tax=Atlantibacter sp. TaxID=1903473 RepID=UPI0028B1FB68|nr:hypothetical protein [Atlantibacter sp.]